MMTFNTLADGLSEAHQSSQRFINSDAGCREYKYRGFRLIEEVIRYKPDVISFQEVDRIEFFKHYLSPFGYKYIHVTKPSSACCRIGKSVGKDLPPDGSAVFWNSKVFALVQSYKFSKQVDKNASKEIGNLSAAVAHLRHKGNKKKEIIVVSTHLKADFSFKSEKQRLKQLCYLMPNLKKICQNNNNIPLFIGLDFNSMPQSVGSFFPYSFQSLMNGKYLLNKLKNNNDNDLNQKENKELNNGEKCILKYNFDDDDSMPQTVIDILSKRGYKNNYGFKFKSAYCYGEYKGKKYGNNPYFTCTCGGLNCLDYIFFEPDKNIQVTHLLTTPQLQQITTPTWDYPSDHFSLMATFTF